MSSIPQLSRDSVRRCAVTFVAHVPETAVTPATQHKMRKLKHIYFVDPAMEIGDKTCRCPRLWSDVHPRHDAKSFMMLSFHSTNGKMDQRRVSTISLLNPPMVATFQTSFPKERGWHTGNVCAIQPSGTSPPEQIMVQTSLCASCYTPIVVSQEVASSVSVYGRPPIGFKLDESHATCSGPGVNTRIESFSCTCTVIHITHPIPLSGQLRMCGCHDGPTLSLIMPRMHTDAHSPTRELTTRIPARVMAVHNRLRSETGLMLGDNGWERVQRVLTASCDTEGNPSLTTVQLGNALEATGFPRVTAKQLSIAASSAFETTRPPSDAEQLQALLDPRDPHDQQCHRSPKRLKTREDGPYLIPYNQLASGPAPPPPHVLQQRSLQAPPVLKGWHFKSWPIVFVKRFLPTLFPTLERQSVDKLSTFLVNSVDSLADFRLATNEHVEKSLIDAGIKIYTAKVIAEIICGWSRGENVPPQFALTNDAPEAVAEHQM